MLLICKEHAKIQLNRQLKKPEEILMSEFNGSYALKSSKTFGLNSYSAQDKDGTLTTTKMTVRKKKEKKKHNHLRCSEMRKTAFLCLNMSNQQGLQKHRTSFVRELKGLLRPKIKFP